MAKSNPRRGQAPRNPGPAGRAKAFKNPSAKSVAKPPRGAKKSFEQRPNPLHFLKADEDDGVIHLPSVEFVEMDESGERAGKKRPKDFRSGARTNASSRNRGRTSTRATTLRATTSKTSAAKPSAPKRRASGTKADSSSGVRLQKILAQAGFGSRRDCEEFILAGRVTIDYEVVTELGTRVLPTQTIHLDGELVRLPQKKAYYALNKPKNVICSNEDPGGRRRAIDFIGEKDLGLFPVGRLDLHSEGLLLITNDGELANRLTHPSYGVSKVYRVRVSGVPTKEEISKIMHGVHLSDGVMKADEVRIRHVYKDGSAMLEITLREGRNREIRRILAKFGHNVLDLVRISVGPVKLGRMPVGAYRPLTSAELRALRQLTGLLEEKQKGKKTKKNS
ncbi:MAG: pseudouridine synthase [Planctomycetia bacterium]|nr:pseudouridine synthase [Planctomycetia bacterium]